jgi:hypothetical protein
LGSIIIVQNYGIGEDGVEIGRNSYTWLGIGPKTQPWAIEEAGGDFNFWRRWTPENSIYGNFYIGIKPLGLVYLGNVLNSSYRLNVDKGTYSYGIYTNGDIRTTTKVYATQFVTTSDLRKKKNISKIQNIQVQKLKLLNGINYQIIEELDTISLCIPIGLDPNSSKYKQLVEENDKLKSQKLAAKQNNPTKSDIQMGFIAQDLQKIYPELVSTDENGFLAVNYISIIPLLVEAYKSQQIVIDELQSKINNLESSQSNATNANSNINITSKDAPILYQNTPNPFTEKTVIACYLPQITSKAQICVYNMQGIQVKCFEISARGNVNTTIEGNGLQAGIYAYVLIYDGKVSDTKQMILTK